MKSQVDGYELLASVSMHRGVLASQDRRELLQLQQAHPIRSQSAVGGSIIDRTSAKYVKRASPTEYLRKVGSSTCQLLLGDTEVPLPRTLRNIPFPTRVCTASRTALRPTPYWAQFPQLLPQLKESTAYVVERFQQMDAEVTDVGFVSDAQEAAIAAEKLRAADCDLIFMFITTYLTSSMVLPIAQRSKTPVLVIDLQPTEKMDHATFGTG